MADGQITIKAILDGKEVELGMKELEERLSGSSGALKSTGAALLGVSTAMVGLGGGAVKTAADFESAMSQVAATTGKTKDEFDSITIATNDFQGSLNDLAIHMGSTTAFSATQAAQALNYLALAGYDAQTMADTLPSVLNLAAAGGMDLANASDMVTDALSALGKNSAYAETMVNQMAAAASHSNTSVAQLGDAILTVGGTAKDMKGGTAELSAALGVLANNGIKAAEGGTHLRNIMLSLQEARSSEAAEWFEKLGINAYDDTGKLRDLNTVFTELKDSMADMTLQERNKALSDIFKITDLAAVNAMLKDSGEAWTELQYAIENSANAADLMANTQLNNLNGTLTILKSGIEGAAISIGNSLTPKIQEVARKLQEWVDKFNQLDEEKKQRIVNIALAVVEVTTAIGGVLVIIGTLIKTVDTVKKVMEGLNLVIGILLANPVVLQVTAIIAIVAALVLAIKNLWDTNEDFRNAVKDIWNAIKQFFIDAAEAIKKAWDGIGKFFADLWAGIKTTTENIWNNIIKFFKETIPNIVKDIGNWFKELPEKIAYGLGLALGKAISWCVDMKDKIAEAIPKLISNIGDWFKELPGKIKTSFDNVIEKVKNWKDNLITNAKNAASSFIDNFINNIKLLPTKIQTAFISAISAVMTFKNDMVAKARETASNFVSSLVDNIRSLPDTLKGIGSNIVSGLLSGITGAWSSFTSSVSNMVNSFVGGIKDGLGIHSPSRVFKQIGVFCVEGLDEGLQDIEDNTTIQDNLIAQAKDVQDDLKKISTNYSFTPTVALAGDSGVFDYNEFGNIISEALGNIGIYMDSTVCGKLVAPSVNKEFGAINTRRI